MRIRRGVGGLPASLRSFQLTAPGRVGELFGLQYLDAATKPRGLFELSTGLRQRGRPGRAVDVARAVHSEPVAGKGDTQSGSCLHERIKLDRRSRSPLSGCCEARRTRRGYRLFGHIDAMKSSIAIAG